jgi:hypothetical protein
VIETLLLLEGYGKSVPYQLAIDKRDTKQKQKKGTRQKKRLISIGNFFCLGPPLMIKQRRNTKTDTKKQFFNATKATVPESGRQANPKVERIHNRYAQNTRVYWIIIASHPERDNRNTCWRISLGATLSQIIYLWAQK